MKWIRVSKQNQCPVCQKADWCSLNPDLNLILCMRVESNRPSKNSMGGWLHPLKANHHIHVVQKRVENTDPTIDFHSMMVECCSGTDPEWISTLASSLGVSSESLLALDCAWSKEHRAWAFPMRDGSGKIVGIRLRKEDGSKFAVKGSREGLFCPTSGAARTAYICEGPTDTAAALSIGLYAIGRPSCMGGVCHLQQWLKLMRVHRIVIVADNDKPGLSGAKSLASVTPIPSCTLVLPVKDMREFVRCGGDCGTLSAILKTMIWTVPRGGESVCVSTPKRLT